MAVFFQKMAGKRCFADLPWSRDETHLAAEFFIKTYPFQMPLDHVTILTVEIKMSRHYCLCR